MTIKLETYILPQHWLPALINGDPTNLDDSDVAQLDAFIADMVERHGQCWAVDTGEDQGFLKYHDAKRYGVLACDCEEVIFDVTPRKAQMVK